MPIMKQLCMVHKRHTVIASTLVMHRDATDAVVMLVSAGALHANGPHAGRGVPLSAVGSIVSPRADAQKLAASWVSNQLYGDTQDQVTLRNISSDPCCTPAHA